MTRTLPITKARQELTKLVENASKRLDEYIITVNGSPAAVVMSFEEYESWKETNEIKNDPGLMKAIREGEADLAAGRMYDWDDVKKELSLDQKKHVSHTNHKQGKKRA